MAWYDGVKVTVIPRKAIFIVVPTREGEQQVSLPYSKRNQALATLLEGLIYEVERKK